MGLVSSVFVPGVGPTNSNILFVGEAPGADEEMERQPFVGESGKKLMEVLLRYGKMRDDVRLDNLCHYRPSSNKFANLIGSTELKDGIRQIHDYIRQHRPNVVCALGNNPLNYLTTYKGNIISRMRGSILTCNGVSGAEDVKLIPTYHPSAVLRDSKLYPIFDFDIGRVVSDSHFADTRYPSRQYIIAPSGYELEEAVRVCENAEVLGTDIETIKRTTKILCVGFSPTPDVAYVFPHDHRYLSSIYRILASNAKKCFHFGYFDKIQLEENGYDVRNYIEDTYIGQHVINPEFPLTLDFITSIHTREPYYKHKGRSAIPSDNKSWSEKYDKDELYEYNGKDCCVTTECHIAQRRDLDADEDLRNIYNAEIEQIEVACSISRAGMYIDQQRRQLLVNALYTSWAKKQMALNMLMGTSVNVKSPKLKDLLYGKLGLPVRKTREGSITTGEDAIVYLIGYVKNRLSLLKRPSAIQEWTIKQAVLSGILEVRGYRQILSNYGLTKISTDGRIRSVYKAGPETGRWACSKFVDGTGNNAQTWPRGYVEVGEQLLTIDADTIRELQEEAEDGESESEEILDQEEAA